MRFLRGFAIGFAATIIVVYGIGVLQLLFEN